MESTNTYVFQESVEKISDSNFTASANNTQIDSPPDLPRVDQPTTSNIVVQDSIDGVVTTDSSKPSIADVLNPVDYSEISGSLIASANLESSDELPALPLNVVSLPEQVTGNSENVQIPDSMIGGANTSVAEFPAAEIISTTSEVLTTEALTTTVSEQQFLAAEPAVSTDVAPSEFAMTVAEPAVESTRLLASREVRITSTVVEVAAEDLPRTPVPVKVAEQLSLISSITDVIPSESDQYITADVVVKTDVSTIEDDIELVPDQPEVDVSLNGGDATEIPDFLLSDAVNVDTLTSVEHQNQQASDGECPNPFVAADSAADVITANESQMEDLEADVSSVVLTSLVPLIAPTDITVAPVVLLVESKPDAPIVHVVPKVLPPAVPLTNEQKMAQIFAKNHLKLMKIFDFYARIHTVIRKHDSFEELKRQNDTMTLAEFCKFGRDFNLLPTLLTLQQMKTIFLKCNQTVPDNSPSLAVPTPSQPLKSPVAVKDVTHVTLTAQLVHQIMLPDDFFRALERISVACFANDGGNAALISPSSGGSGAGKKNPAAFLKLIAHMALPPKTTDLAIKMHQQQRVPGSGPSQPAPNIPVVSATDSVGPDSEVLINDPALLVTPRYNVGVVVGKSPANLQVHHRTSMGSKIGLPVNPRKPAPLNVFHAVVGGKVFEVSTASVMRYPKSRIASLMADGYGHTLFFDRSPANFELVAEFLRSSVQLPAVLPEGVTLESIYSDAVYYGLATEMFGAGFDPSTGILPPRVQAFEHSEVRMLAPSDIWSVSVRPFEQLALDRIQSTDLSLRLLMNVFENVAVQVPKTQSESGDDMVATTKAIQSRRKQNAELVYDGAEALELTPLLMLPGNHRYEFYIDPTSTTSHSASATAGLDFPVNTANPTHLLLYTRLVMQLSDQQRAPVSAPDFSPVAACTSASADLPLTPRRAHAVAQAQAQTRKSSGMTVGHATRRSMDSAPTAAPANVKQVIVENNYASPLNARAAGAYSTQHSQITTVNSAAAAEMLVSPHSRILTGTPLSLVTMEPLHSAAPAVANTAASNHYPNQYAQYAQQNQSANAQQRSPESRIYQPQQPPQAQQQSFLQQQPQQPQGYPQFYGGPQGNVPQSGQPPYGYASQPQPQGYYQGFPQNNQGYPQNNYYQQGPPQQQQYTPQQSPANYAPPHGYSQSVGNSNNASAVPRAQLAVSATQQRASQLAQQERQVQLERDQTDAAVFSRLDRNQHSRSAMEPQLQGNGGYDYQGTTNNNYTRAPAQTSSIQSASEPYNVDEAYSAAAASYGGGGGAGARIFAQRGLSNVNTSRLPSGSSSTSKQQPASARLPGQPNGARGNSGGQLLAAVPVHQAAGVVMRASGWKARE